MNDPGPETNLEEEARSLTEIAVHNPVLNVCPDLKLKFLHNGQEAGSPAWTIANEMADATQMADGRACTIDEIHADTMEAKAYIFILEDDGGNGREACKAFVQKLLERSDRFDYGTYFAFLVLGQGILPLAQLMQDRLSFLEGTPIIPLRIVEQADQAAQLASVHEWGSDLDQGTAAVLRELAVETPLFVCRQRDPARAYCILDKAKFQPIPLSGPTGRLRGKLFKGVCLPRNGGLFMKPSEEEAEHVAIKVIDTHVANELIINGCPENHNREIVLLHTLQSATLRNERIVPKLIEVLFDGRYLYIIMEWANGGSLYHLPHEYQGPVPPQRVKNLSKDMFSIINIVHEKFGWAHHDIKGANFLIHNGRLLLTDWAQAIRIPPGGIIRAHAHHGTVSSMSPEHYANMDYDVCQNDRWGVCTAIYCLATGSSIMYGQPTSQDLLYEYIVSRANVSRTHPNPRVQEMERLLEGKMNLTEGHLDIAVFDSLLDESDQNTARVNMYTNRLANLRETQREISTRIRALPETLLEMFERAFDPNPQNRGTALELTQMA
ncbi:MAG: hypothetical protein SGILL_006367, partial [Bacillariaceae sp.]